MTLAKKIAREDYRDLYEQEGELLLPVIRVLDYCFRSFRPDMGPQTRPAWRRFLSRFRFYLKLRLNKDARRRRQRRSKQPRMKPLPDNGWKRLRKTKAAAADDEYETWCAYLYRQALLRLDPRTCSYINLRLAGECVEDIARRFGLSAKTVSNLFGRKQLVRRIRQAVAGLVLGLPVKERHAIANYFLHEEEFSIEQVERLLCLPYAELANGLEGRVRALEPEQVRDLLSGERRWPRSA
jgi:hypothetical protein